MEKIGITRPHPEGRVKKTRKVPGALDPAVVLCPLGVQNK